MHRVCVAAIAGALVLGACGVDSNEESALGFDAAVASMLPGVGLDEFVISEARINTLAERPGDPHLYVAEQSGLVLRIERPTVTDGTAARIESTRELFDQQALDITGNTASNGEEGLVGLAFDPAGDFAYVNHSRLADGHSVIAEYRVDDTGRFDVSSRRELFVIEQSSAAHNAGQLLFGPDGYLYLGIGDGSEFTDLDRRALDLSSPLGKILRIDPRPNGDHPYSVPEDNPFAPFEPADGRIWSSGLRNPFSFSFDPLTGDLWIADVGQGAAEEINFAPATDGLDAGKGRNFGWSAFEGNERFNLDQPAADHSPPYLTYGHEGGRCAVIDGVRVRDSAIAALDGWYVFGDWCSGEVWAHNPAMPSVGFVELAKIPGPTQILQTADGNLYLSSHFGTIALLTPR